MYWHITDGQHRIILAASTTTFSFWWAINTDESIPVFILWKTICLCFYFQHPRASTNNISLCIEQSLLRLLKCCSLGWYQLRRMFQMCQKNSLLFWQRCCWLSLWNLARTVTCLFSKHLIWASHVSLLCFCPKQTLTCAVPVTAATSEGSALGLYLERWPSPSAAAPAQSMPTENPANRAHRKILVCIFKSHARATWIENTPVICPDTSDGRIQSCVIKQRNSLLERQSHTSKHTNTLIQQSLFISPVYFHINRLRGAPHSGKHFSA